MNAMESVVPIEQICRTIMNGTVLDVFLLIVQEPDLSKAEMAARFVKASGVPNGKPTRFRAQVREGLAKLEGALFVACWSDGVHQRYRLTEYGKVAQDIVAGMMMREDADRMLLRSIITKQYVIGEGEEGEGHEEHTARG